MTDIVDTIDQLIDEQLQAGEHRTRLANQYPQCPHCVRDWHGIPITERMEEMRQSARFDESYRFSDDESVVLCRGSEFIGPQPLEPPPWGGAGRLGVVPQWGFLAADDGVHLFDGGLVWRHLRAIYVITGSVDDWIPTTSQEVRDE